MSGWLKAGVIGAVIVVVLKVLQVIPCVNCCAIPAEWVAYGCIGALAAYWIRPVRTMGAGAGQGALAALIAAAIGGVIGIGVSVVGATVLAPMQESVLRQMPPEFFSQLAEAGIDPSLITRTGGTTAETITSGVMCCGAGLVIAAVLGAVGGLVFAAVKPRKATV
ncbi:MAG TPA: hypothetical protein VJ714_03055 [Anaerolineae bacterium]|nr:hypothetical protein [Anaerolineae bacterium]